MWITLSYYHRAIRSISVKYQWFTVFLCKPISISCHLVYKYKYHSSIDYVLRISVWDILLTDTEVTSNSLWKITEYVLQDNVSYSHTKVWVYLWKLLRCGTTDRLFFAQTLRSPRQQARRHMLSVLVTRRLFLSAILLGRRCWKSVCDPHSRNWTVLPHKLTPDLENETNSNKKASSLLAHPSAHHMVRKNKVKKKNV